MPLIRGGHKRVYVLSAPKTDGVVLYGNDYLIDFDKTNQIASVKRIHNSLISASAGDKSDTAKTVLEFIHSHVEGKEPFMTATDICTTMLYQHLTTWKQSIVISKNYVSIWDCDKRLMFVLTMDAWKKIAGDQSSKKPQ
ncbi:hypothetical protein GWR56_04800 [Mucilaginibacter sp. 14171R-50]|uniref:hypothetical protein n=1 Tax=Mucilaginibacter sp. 14171R-50 TaxID=2703789 RepID=UPI00138B818D|nr:hypothetical protein [Mucilaginibacter sp. 14171R-50]QHS54898.1 hypothetical protein GWR56_04800 [Mucilaginibacter sp. 14171R-50]